MNNSLRLLLIINSIFVLAANLLGPLYAVFIQGIGGSLLAVTGTWSVMLVTTTLANLVLIKYGDRVKEHEHFLLIGYLLRAIAWIGFTFTHSVPTIIVMQIIIGIGEAVGSTGFDAIFAEHLDRHQHIRDYAIWKTISNLVMAIATILGGYIVASYGFNLMFYTMGTIALLCAVVTIILPRKIL